MKNLAIFTLLLAFCLPLQGQIDIEEPAQKPVDSNINGQKVSFTKLLLEMEKAAGWVVFKDLEVVFNHKEDKKNGMDEWFMKQTKALHFKAKHIGIYNCTFDEEYWLVLRNATFDGHLSIVGCKNVKAMFDNCTFKQAMRCHDNEFEFAKFTKCRFELGFRFTRGQVTDYLTFSNCTFDFNTALKGIGGGFDMDDRLFYISNKLDGLDITIDSCLFKKNKALETIASFVDLSDSQYKNLIVQNSTFETCLNLEKSVVNGYLDLSNNLIKEGILPYGMTYNFNNSNIIWDDLQENTISIYDKSKDQVLNKLNVNDVLERKNLNKIISSYTAIFNSYKSQGNKEWANKCYYQWKEIETEGYYKQKEVTSYTLNVFLAVFCDYGTNPIKAAKYSVLIILIFSIIYMFIPFDEPNTFPSAHSRRKGLIQKFKNSPGNYVTLYIRETYAFTTQYKSNRSPVITKMKVKLFDWVEKIGQSKINKRLNGLPLQTSFALMHFFSGVQQYLPKFLHAAVLSMNAFVTLGFGSMKVKGDYIYLSILEGIFGWFLLSIFTVSLINQIINW